MLDGGVLFRTDGLIYVSGFGNAEEHVGSAHRHELPAEGIPEGSVFRRRLARHGCRLLLGGLDPQKRNVGLPLFRQGTIEGEDGFHADAGLL